jgi:hypothetical protein
VWNELADRVVSNTSRFTRGTFENRNHLLRDDFKRFGVAMADALHECVHHAARPPQLRVVNRLPLPDWSVSQVDHAPGFARRIVGERDGKQPLKFRH